MTLVISDAEAGSSVRTKLNSGLRNTLIATDIKTGAYIATAGDLVLTNSTGGVFAVTLPPTPSDGDPVGVLDVTDQWGTNNVTVARNGSNIEGAASDLVLDGGRYAELVYTGASRGWVLNFVSNAVQYEHPNHTGDVTSTGDGATAIAASAVTNAKLANMDPGFVKMRTTAGAGDPEDIEIADNAAVRASTPGRPLVAGNIEAASAIVTLADAATIAVDWDTFINGEVTLTDNRTLGLPTNGQPGTWRSIDVIQDVGGTNTLAFASGYLFVGGVAPVVTATGDARSKLSIFCRTASLFEVFSALDMKAPV